MTTWYIDYVNGDNSNNGSNWSQAWRDWDGISGVAPGDLIKVAKTPDPVSIGNATWSHGSDIVTLASPKTENIDDCEDAWTPEAGVTQSNDSSYATEGDYCQRFGIGSGGFTSGPIAYHEFATAKDLSSYTKISFSIRLMYRSLDANTLSIRFYSDSDRTMLVHNFPINFKIPVDRTLPITLDNGAALGSNIKVIELYADVDISGHIRIYIDNILACNDLTLSSVIGKNTSSEKEWWHIGYINGNSIKLAKINSYSASDKGTKYTGQNGTVETFVRNSAVIPSKVRYDDDSNFMTSSVNGNSGSLITISGGWDPSTNLQDGESWLDLVTPFGVCELSGSYTKLEKCSFVRGRQLYLSGSYNQAETIHLVGNRYYGLHVSDGIEQIVDDTFVVSCCDYGPRLRNATISDLSVYRSYVDIEACSVTGSLSCYGSRIDIKDNVDANNIVVRSNDGTGVLIYQSANVFIEQVDVEDCDGYGIHLTDSKAITLESVSVQNCNDDGVYIHGINSFDIYIHDATLVNNGSYGLLVEDGAHSIFIDNLETSGHISRGLRVRDSEVHVESNNCSDGISYYFPSQVPRFGLYFSHKDQVAGSHIAYLPVGTISADNTVYHTAAPSWKMEVTSDSRLEILVFRIPAQAGVSRTVRAWTRWDSTVEPKMKPKAILRGCGITKQEDVNTELSGNWDQLVVTATPTRNGILHFSIAFQRAYNTPLTVYVDDVTWS